MAEARAVPLRIGYSIKLPMPHDRDVSRDRAGRWISFIVTAGLTIVLPIMFFGFIGTKLGSTEFGRLVGFGLGGAFLAYFAPRRLLVYNPEWTAYVTQNMFGGGTTAYGPGWHPSHISEERNEEGVYSLKLDTHHFSVTVPTKTADITISGEVPFATRLALIERAIGIPKADVGLGLTSFVQQFLTGWCADKDAEEVRKMIPQLVTALATQFVSDPDSNEVYEDTVEYSYGIFVSGIIITGVAFSAAAQKTRDGRDEMAVIQQIIAQSFGLTVAELNAARRSKEISEADYREAYDRALVVTDNNTNLQLIKGDAGAAIAGAFQGMMGGNRKGGH